MENGWVVIVAYPLVQQNLHYSLAVYFGGARVDLGVPAEPVCDQQSIVISTVCWHFDKIQVYHGVSHVWNLVSSLQTSVYSVVLLRLGTRAG